MYVVPTEGCSGFSHAVRFFFILIYCFFMQRTMMFSCYSLRYLSLISILLSIPVSLCTQCYYPDRSPADTHTPCSEDSGHSACCGPDDYCLTNGLCISYMQLKRGSCTDSTWTAPTCPFQCRDGKSRNMRLEALYLGLLLNILLEWRNSTTPIVPCYDGFWTCFLDGCSNFSNKFPISNGQIILRTNETVLGAQNRKVSASSNIATIATATTATSPTAGGLHVS